jgi:ribonuclease P protein component
VAVSLLSYCRVAVIVGKYSHTIVERNRLRRRIRELVRTRLLPLYKGLDLVMRAQPGAYAADFGQLGKEIDQIKAQLAMIVPNR